LCTPDDAAHLDAIDKELNATIWNHLEMP
jgi:hypothetical protein